MLTCQFLRNEDLIKQLIYYNNKYSHEGEKTEKPKKERKSKKQEAP